MTLTLKHGVSPFSLMGFSTASAAIAWLTSRYQRSQNLGELSVILSRKYDYRTTEYLSLFAFGGFQADQHYSLKRCIEMLKESHQKALIYGDFLYAGYAISMICWHKLYAGTPIDLLLQEVRKAIVFNNRMQNDLPLEASRVLELYLLALQGKSLAPTTISNETFDVKSEWKIYQKKEDDYMLFRIGLSEANLCFLHGDYAKAKKWIDKGKELLVLRVNFQIWIHTHYIECLVLAGLYPTLNFYEKRKCLKTFRKNLNILENWASDPTKNKCHFYPLAKAEYNRLFHPNEDAIEDYLQAIEIAKENQFIQDEAIANELAGKYQREKGRVKIADTFIKKARFAYQQWGAYDKAIQLEFSRPSTYP